MSSLVATCPRCKVQKMTFDVLGANFYEQHHGWQRWYEVFAESGHCHRCTIFVLADDVDSDHEGFHKVNLVGWDGVLNNYTRVEGHITLKDEVAVTPPEHLPPEINAAFREGATCFAVGCYNAAGAMFRLCLDFATKARLPAENIEGLKYKIRRDLGLRLPWLFKHGLLPPGLEPLSHCIREDGNDGAHAGTLTKPEAEDLLDFTIALLETLYTEPKRLALCGRTS